MLSNKASVALYKEDRDSSYRITIYMGIEADSGPDDGMVLMSSVNDLYTYFNSYTTSDSYRMAEFCLLCGFNVVGQRVNTVTGPSSARKFIMNGQSFFFCPRQGVDYTEDFINPFNPVLNEEDALYSLVLSFDETVSDNAFVNNNFMLIAPRLVYDQYGNTSAESVTVMVLAGCGVIDDEIYNRFTLNELVSVYRLTSELTYAQFKQQVLAFLQERCNFTIEEVEGTTSSYLLISQTNISEVVAENCFLMSDVDEETLLANFSQSEIGLNDNYCRLYDSYKVATVYSKYPTCIDDIEVEIVLSDGYYYVYVSKFDSEGTVILSENFQYLQRNIEYLSNDSEFVEIEVHDSSADLSGTYTLKGQERIDELRDFSDSIDEVNGQSAFIVDIAVDNNDDTSLARRQQYISDLKVYFPNSLIFTDLGGLEDLEQVVQVGPDVTWMETGETMRGFSYLLYLLPSYHQAQDEDLITLSPSDDFSEDDCQNLIKETDYGVVILSAKTQLKTVFPLKSLLSVICMENIITQDSFTTESAFNSLVQSAMSTVNSYLGTSSVVEVKSYKNTRGRVTAQLTVSVDKYIISSFRVEATVTW